MNVQPLANRSDVVCAARASVATADLDLAGNAECVDRGGEPPVCAPLQRGPSEVPGSGFECHRAVGSPPQGRDHRRLTSLERSVPMRLARVGPGVGALVLIGSLAAAPLAQAAAKVINGTEGPDQLVGTAQNDKIFARGGADQVLARGGRDEARGGAGNDALHGGDGKDVVRGQAGADVIRGQRSGDGLRGGSGNDVVAGGKGGDFLGSPIKPGGGGGDDTLRGGPDADVLVGGKGNDVLRGGGNKTAGEFLQPDRGRDVVFGGPGDDTVFLAVDGSRDVVRCGSGSDTIRYRKADPRDVVISCETVDNI